ncbi:MAG: hypothetical protein V4548_14035 [Bacteroidota bacterium]
MTNRIKITFAISVLAIISILSFTVFGKNSDVSKFVSSKKIKNITPGMTYEKVISIMGKPINVMQSGTLTVLEYSRPVKYCKNYPMLWVNLDSNMNVDHVYAKRYLYFGADDECIYFLNAKSKFIDEDKFMYYFE